MAAGPTKRQVYSAERKLCIRTETEMRAKGYGVIRVGAKRVNVFQDSTLGVLIGSIWPRVLRASNGEACVLLDSDSDILRELIS